jgi:DNA-binding CsgD family transcriptional regulator/PAS domain-containing protein
MPGLPAAHPSHLFEQGDGDAYQIIRFRLVRHSDRNGAVWTFEMKTRSAISRIPADWIGPLQDDDRLSTLISRIYEAALEPALWSEVLRGIGDFVGDDAGARPWHESIDGSIECQDGARVIRLRPNPPQGGVEAAYALLQRSDAARACLDAITRRSGQAADDDPVQRRMAAVIAHVRRAIAISNAVERRRAEAAAFADALDGLGSGVFMVDAEGRLVHANAAARTMLAADDFLRTVGGRLVARDPRAHQTLRDIYADDGAAPKRMSLILTTRDGERRVAHALRLNPGRRAGDASAATVALFVRKAVLPAPATPDIIAKACNLTPAELRVLLAIVEVGGVPEVANALGIAETTVKTHLGRLFEKTGASRQADLVKLVAGFASPMAG